MADLTASARLLRSGEMGHMKLHTTGANNVLTGIATVTGILAAGFWFWSASTSIPGIYLTFDADFSPLTNALRWQSHLSAIAAGLTGVSVICQAVAQSAAKWFWSDSAK